MIHFKSDWPFLETSGTRNARQHYERAVKQRPKVDSLSSDLIRRGQVNHFAEQWEEILRDRRGDK